MKISLPGSNYLFIDLNIITDIFLMFEDILFALSHDTIIISSEFAVSINEGRYLPQQKMSLQQTKWQRDWVRHRQGHLYIIGRVVDLRLSLAERHIRL